MTPCQWSARILLQISKMGCHITQATSSTKTKSKACSPKSSPKSSSTQPLPSNRPKHPALGIRTCQRPRHPNPHLPRNPHPLRSRPSLHLHHFCCKRLLPPQQSRIRPPLDPPTATPSLTSKLKPKLTSSSAKQTPHHPLPPPTTPTPS
jgi:hypothetical protein